MLSSVCFEWAKFLALKPPKSKVVAHRAWLVSPIPKLIRIKAVHVIVTDIFFKSSSVILQALCRHDSRNSVCGPDQSDRGVHSEHQLVLRITTVVFPEVEYNLLFTIPSFPKAALTLWLQFLCVFKFHRIQKQKTNPEVLLKAYRPIGKHEQ